MEMAATIWRQQLAVIEPDSAVVEQCIQQMQILSAQRDHVTDDTMWQAICQSQERTAKQLSAYVDKLDYVQQREQAVSNLEIKTDMATPKAKQVVESYSLFHGAENVEIAAIIPTYLALAESVLRLKTDAEAAYQSATLEDRSRYYATFRFLQQQYLSLIAYKERLLENALLRLESLAQLGQVAQPLAAYATFHGIKLPIVSPAYLPLDHWHVSHFLTFYRLLSTHATGERARRLAAIDWQLGHLYYRDDGVLVLCPHLYKSSDLYLHKPWFTSVFTGKQVLYDLFTNPYDLLQLHKAIDGVEKQADNTLQTENIIDFIQQSYAALEQVEIEKKRVESAISGLWWIFSAHPLHVANTWLQHLASKKVLLLQRVAAQYAKLLDTPTLCCQLAQKDWGVKLAHLAADCESENVSMLAYMPDQMATTLRSRIARALALLLLDKHTHSAVSQHYLEQIFSERHGHNVRAIIGSEAYRIYAHVYEVIKKLSVSNYIDLVAAIDDLTKAVDMSAIFASIDPRFSTVGSASLILHQAAVNHLYAVQRKRSASIFQMVKSSLPPAIAEKLRMPAIQPYNNERMPTIAALHDALMAEPSDALQTIPDSDALRYEWFICPKSSKQLQDAIMRYVSKRPAYSKALATVVLSYGSLDTCIDYVGAFVLEKMESGMSILEALQGFPIPILDGQYASVLDEVYTMLDEHIVAQLEQAITHHDETICALIRQWMHNRPCGQHGEPVVSGWKTILPDLVGDTWSPLRAELMWQFGSQVDQGQYSLRWLSVILYSNADYPIDDMVQFYREKQRRYPHWWSCFGGDTVASYSLSCYCHHVLPQSMVGRASVEMMSILFSDPQCVSYYQLSECEETYRAMLPRWQQQQYLVDDIQMMYQTTDGACARAALERVVSQLERQPQAVESIAGYKQLAALLWQHIATQVQHALVQGEMMPLALYKDLLQRLVALPMEVGLVSQQYAFLSWLSSVSAYISTASIKVAYGVEHNQPISSWLNSLTLVGD
jgi:hypothetical protein